MLELDVEGKTYSNAKIAVVGVGGGAANAMSHVIEENNSGVEFIQMNTDINGLFAVKATIWIQIGEKLTKGYGTGVKPEIGEKAAEGRAELIAAALKDMDMVFIVCCMGGGAGTGAAPVVAKIAKDMGILTVGVVTKPFKFEAKMRKDIATSGIERLKACVDTLIVISNDKFSETSLRETPLPMFLRKSDEVLHRVVQSFVDLINLPSIIGLDITDVEYMMKDKGIAHIGIGRAEGEEKAAEAARLAVESPLLENAMSRASDIIINITGDITLSDSGEAAGYVKRAARDDANIIWGARYDENMKEEAIVTIIAIELKP